MIAQAKRLLLPTCLVVFGLLAAPTLAAGQVEITADRFVVQEASSLATFSGNVVIHQDSLTVNADRVVVHYGAGGASDIESLEAIGKVIITTPEQTVTGERGIYNPSNRVMRVIGNVVATSPTGRVTGPELLVNFATNVTEFVNSSGKRVTGVFNP